MEVLRERSGLTSLTLIGSALKIYNAGKNNADGDGLNQRSHSCRKITHEHCRTATYGTEKIQRKDGSTVPKAKIRKPVSSVVLPRGGEGQQAPARPGYRDQRRIENRHAQNQNRRKPCRKMIGVL